MQGAGVSGIEVGESWVVSPKESEIIEVPAVFELTIFFFDKLGQFPQQPLTNFCDALKLLTTLCRAMPHTHTHTEKTHPTDGLRTPYAELCAIIT